MAEIKRYEVTEPYLNLNCQLGEAPFYEARRHALRFVDIINKTIHFVDLAEGPSSHRKLDLEHSISVTADIEGNDDEFVFGGKLGYGIMNRETGAVRWIKKMWGDADRKDDGGGKPGRGGNRENRMRSNDGSVDCKGRFWVGAMNDDQVVGDDGVTDEGILFRLDNDLSLHRVMAGVKCPNGISWSRDNKTMYFTDSPSGVITQYPYIPETGEMSIEEGKPFFKVEGGIPDGHCRDEEDCFWVAGHSVGKVFRVSPQGKMLAEVDVPTRCVTCPVLCGTELFITTMKEVDPQRHPESVKLQGAVFKVDVGVRGKLLNKFRMTTEA